ncbi:MAG TPA: hypothetical protein VK178_13015 [Opitutaceae bacterium]|nr:hypothetical protein [Opitutaceae bacterium]
MKSLLALICSLFAVCFIRAQDAEMSALQNLPEVGVLVRGLSPDGAKLGLTESALIAGVRAVLEPAGVKIIPPPMLERLPQAPVLEITANVSLTGKTSYFFILDLQLREQLKPARAHRTLVTIPAVTWAQQMAGVTAKAENVQAALARLTQRFAEEWEQAQAAAPTH